MLVDYVHPIIVLACLVSGASWSANKAQTRFRCGWFRRLTCWESLYSSYPKCLVNSSWEKLPFLVWAVRKGIRGDADEPSYVSSYCNVMSSCRTKMIWSWYERQHIFRVCRTTTALLWNHNFWFCVILATMFRSVTQSAKNIMYIHIRHA